jgi:protein-S-isoprenylcysteine O-methyltransferase Ste14
LGTYVPQKIEFEAEDMEDIKNRPNRVPWPPLIVASSLAAGFLLNSAFPLAGPNQYLQGKSMFSIGNLLFYSGLALDLAAMFTMFRARTNILPHRAADRLLASGPFAFTRNPIYVGNTLFLLGVAISWANFWLVLITGIAVIAVDRLAIRREEKHLQARFGESYTQYTQSVPRWIGLKTANL